MTVKTEPALPQTLQDLPPPPSTTRLNISLRPEMRIPITPMKATPEKVEESVPINYSLNDQQSKKLKMALDVTTKSNFKHIKGKVYKSKRSVTQAKEMLKKCTNMTVQDVTKEQKIYACQKDINLLKKPLDTIRCTSCNGLYEMKNYKEHVKSCTRNNTTVQRKYVCVICRFSHIDFLEMIKHKELVHKKTTSTNLQ